MAEDNKTEIILMAIFTVTKDDVMACADEVGLGREQVTDSLLELVKERLSQGLGGWRAAIKSMVVETIGCPLGLVCSPSCAWREVGQCRLARVEG